MSNNSNNINCCVYSMRMHTIAKLVIYNRNQHQSQKYYNIRNKDIASCTSLGT